MCECCSFHFKPKVIEQVALALQAAGMKVGRSHQQDSTTCSSWWGKYRKPWAVISHWHWASSSLCLSCINTALGTHLTPTFTKTTSDLSKKKTPKGHWATPSIDPRVFPGNPPCFILCCFHSCVRNDCWIQFLSYDFISCPGCWKWHISLLVLRNNRGIFKDFFFQFNRNLFQL